MCLNIHVRLHASQGAVWRCKQINKKKNLGQKIPFWKRLFWRIKFRYYPLESLLYFYFHNKPVWKMSIKIKNEDSWINEWHDLFQLWNRKVHKPIMRLFSGLKHLIMPVNSWILHEVKLNSVQRKIHFRMVDYFPFNFFCFEHNSYFRIFGNFYTALCGQFPFWAGFGEQFTLDTALLLVWKWVALSLIKDNFLWCWNCLFRLSWIRGCTFSLLPKLALRRF